MFSMSQTEVVDLFKRYYHVSFPRYRITEECTAYVIKEGLVLSQNSEVLWLHFIPHQALTHCEKDLTLWPFKLTVDRFLLMHSLCRERVNHDPFSGSSLKESLFCSSDTHRFEFEDFFFI